jgi:hypothetical protein
MTNPDDLDQRWRAIAEQLGLEPETTRTSQPRAEEQADAPPPRQLVVNERPVAEIPADEPWLESRAPAPDEDFPDPLDDLQKAETPGGSITDVIQREECADLVGPSDETSTGKDGPRSGRSRRRRRRRSKSGKEAAANAPDEDAGVKDHGQIDSQVEESTRETDSAEGPRQEAEEDMPRRRSRRRSRRDLAERTVEERRESDPGSPPQAPAQEEAPAKEEGPVMEGLADEDEDLSKWEVPSWQELIASLYRPER